MENNAAFVGHFPLQSINARIDFEYYGDHPEVEVRWEAGDIRALAGKSASLRFVLKSGSLYSYGFGTQ